MRFWALRAIQDADRFASIGNDNVHIDPEQLLPLKSVTLATYVAAAFWRVPLLARTTATAGQPRTASERKCSSTDSALVKQTRNAPARAT